MDWKNIANVNLHITSTIILGYAALHVSHWWKLLCIILMSLTIYNLVDVVKEMVL